MIRTKGAIKVSLEDSEVRVDPFGKIAKLVERLTVEAKPQCYPLKREDLHLTLLLPRSIKPYRNLLPRGSVDIETPAMDLGTNIFSAIRSESGGKQRASWFCIMRNQVEWQCFMRRFRARYGLPPELETDRIFHVSIANLTGSPFDSVGDVGLHDMAFEAF